jgi:dCTP deaminase
MQSGEHGVLPSQSIRSLIRDGIVGADTPVEEGQIQPASLDLRLGDIAYRVRASFLPGREHTVADRLDDFAMHRIDLRAGAVLETGCVYLVPLQEQLALPPSISAAANAKSSTGRLDLFTRLIGDHATEFDRLDPGYAGPLYAEISPRTFSVLARTGVRLNQIRFRTGDAAYTPETLVAMHETHRLVTVDGEPMPMTAADAEGGVGFSVDLRGNGGPVGYRAKRHSALIDLDRIGAYPVDEFWDTLYTDRHGRLILDPGAFYILASREAVHVPPDCAAEMTPYSALVGEFRVHYAGFFDPGFGHSATGGSGARGVLEVRCHETPFALEHGQIVGRLVYEAMRETPDILYGIGGLGSNYQGQGLKLSKHFR